MTSTQLRDDIIENEVANKRVAASISREIEHLIKTLRTELQLLTLKSGALTAKRPETRQRRYRKLNSASKKLINEAYREIRALTKRELVRFSLAESAQTEIAVENNT